MPYGPQSYAEVVSTCASFDAYKETIAARISAQRYNVARDHVCPLKHFPPPGPCEMTLAQLSSGGSTFYANGYDNGNKDGWVMMQTISGVADDGREVVAVVAPGKYPPGSSALVEARHIVGKPEGLDWDRAAMFPFLVSVARSRLDLPHAIGERIVSRACRYHIPGTRYR